MFQSQDESWLEGWCERTLEVLRNWEDWAGQIQKSSLGVSAATIDLLVQQGDLLTRHLSSLMNERREILDGRSIHSLRHLIDEASPRRGRLLEKIKMIEALSVLVRQRSAAHWVTAKQSAKYIDDLLFMFRSGQSGRATYSTNEDDAFQGGVVLDSTA